MKLAKVPKVGDILKFKLSYTFTKSIDYTPSPYSTTTGTTITAGYLYNQHGSITVDKGTLVEVVERDLIPTSDSMSDDLDMTLVVAVIVNTKLEFFKFNYSIHQASVEVLDSSVALKLLYGNK